jgi:hypothetical protein
MPEPGTPRAAAVNDSAAALLAVVDAYLEVLRQGKAPDRAAVLAAHPELAPQLESCLAALDFIHRAERTDPAVPQTLGDFRIVREIGRGAMGVVYEAASAQRRPAVRSATPAAAAAARMLCPAARASRGPAHRVSCRCAVFRRHGVRSCLSQTQPVQGVPMRRARRRGPRRQGRRGLPRFPSRRAGHPAISATRRRNRSSRRA